MFISEICQRDVATAHADENLITAAERMRERHVGSLVVTAEPRAARHLPVGMLTDRDIVVAVVARDAAHLSSLSVGDVMTTEPISVRATDSLDIALQRLRVYGVRRAPVVDDEGLLVGVIAIDDLVVYASDLLASLAEVMHRGVAREEGRRG